MEQYKLHIKIGVHEFQGEGPEATVRADFDEWKRLIAPLASKSQGLPAGTGLMDVNEVLPLADERLKKLFSVDSKGVISTKMRPNTTTPIADTLLLVLLGYRLINKNEEGVPVLQVSNALRMSGFSSIKRVDRCAGVPAYVKDVGLIIQGGKKGPGSTYQLSNQGIIRAQQLMDSMLAQVS